MGVTVPGRKVHLKNSAIRLPPVGGPAQSAEAKAAHQTGKSATKQNPSRNLTKHLGAGAL